MIAKQYTVNRTIILQRNWKCLSNNAGLLFSQRFLPEDFSSLVGTRVTVIRRFALIERFLKKIKRRKGDASTRTRRRFRSYEPKKCGSRGSRSLNSSKLRRIEGNNFLHSWQEAIERTDRTGRRHATHPRVTQSRIKSAQRHAQYIGCLQSTHWAERKKFKFNQIRSHVVEYKGYPSAILTAG